MLTSDRACADPNISPDVVSVSPAPRATRSMFSTTSRVPLAAASRSSAMLTALISEFSITISKGDRLVFKNPLNCHRGGDLSRLAGILQYYSTVVGLHKPV